MHHRVTRSLALVLGASAMAACADAPSRVAGPTPNAPNFSVDETGYLNAHLHVMPLKSQAQEAHADAQAKNGARRTTSNGISYHGGPVLQAGTKVASIYWASSPIYSGGPSVGSHGAGSQDGSLVGYFLSNLGGSAYFGINTTYTDGSGRAIVNSVSYTQYWANGTNAPTGTQSVSDAQMVSMLQSGFDSGALTYDPNTVYAIFTAGQVNLGGGFGSQYCAYHTHGTVTVNGVSQTVLYAAMPYNYGYPSSCTSGYAAANGDPGADYEVNTLAHEIEETTTDMMGNAWYDTRGYENADKCAWTWGTTYTSAAGGTANMKIGAKDFLVQQNWKNAGGGGCVLHL